MRKDSYGTELEMFCDVAFPLGDSVRRGQVVGFTNGSVIEVLYQGKRYKFFDEQVMKL